MKKVLEANENSQDESSRKNRKKPDVENRVCGRSSCDLCTKCKRVTSLTGIPPIIEDFGPSPRIYFMLFGWLGPESGIKNP